MARLVTDEGPIPPNVAVISIYTNHHDEVGFPRDFPNPLLRISFHDEYDDMTIEKIADQAHYIARFVLKSIRDGYDTFYINCGGAVTRSPAVAAAIKQVINGYDGDIWNNQEYEPNGQIYEIVYHILQKYKEKENYENLFESATGFRPSFQS